MTTRTAEEERAYIALGLRDLASWIGDRDWARMEACLYVANMLERGDQHPPGTCVDWIGPIPLPFPKPKTFDEMVAFARASR